MNARSNSQVNPFSMNMPTLSAEELAYLQSLPSSALNQFLKDLAREDVRKAAWVQDQLSTFQENPTATEASNLLSRTHSNAKAPKLTRVQLAQIAGVSPSTVDHWKDKGCPYENLGNHQASSYDLGEVFAWYIRNTGGNAASAIVEDIRQEDLATKRLKRLQLEGSLVEVSKYREALLAINVQIQAGVKALHQQFGTEAVELLSRVVNEAERKLLEMFEKGD